MFDLSNAFCDRTRAGPAPRVWADLCAHRHQPASPPPRSSPLSSFFLVSWHLLEHVSGLGALTLGVTLTLAALRVLSTRGAFNTVLCGPTRFRPHGTYNTMVGHAGRGSEMDRMSIMPMFDASVQRQVLASLHSRLGLSSLLTLCFFLPTVSRSLPLMLTRLHSQLLNTHATYRGKSHDVCVRLKLKNGTLRFE